MPLSYQRSFLGQYTAKLSYLCKSCRGAKIALNPALQYYCWSENGPQNSGFNEIGSRTAKNKDFVGSDHCYSEVQYHQSAYNDATLTRNVYLPSTLPEVAVQSRIALADYQSKSLRRRSQNPSIHQRIYSEPSNSSVFFKHTNDLRS